MANPHEVVRTLAIANSTFANTITTGGVVRFYAGVAPQNAALPFCQSFVINAQHDHNMTVASGLVRVSMQVDVYAETLSSACDIGNKLRLAIGNVLDTNVTIGSETVKVQSLRIVQENTGFVQPENAADVTVRRASYDYSLFYEITPA